MITLTLHCKPLSRPPGLHRRRPTPVTSSQPSFCNKLHLSSVMWHCLALRQPTRIILTTSASISSYMSRLC